ncbi:MAG: UDP-N-acetylmuramate dehydrogenase [Syntrophomonadaceae bacterium]
MYSNLKNIVGSECLLFNEPMSRHTTFAIGGPVDVLVNPRSIEEIKSVLAYCSRENLPCTVFGLGSNLLVRDKGIRGVAIKIGDCLTAADIMGTDIMAQAGISLSRLAYLAAEHSLSGLEFAEGIPGSLGGAVAMNAGAYGGEMKDILVSCTALDETGQTLIFNREDMNLGYRSSIFQQRCVTIIEAHLRLVKGEKEDILARMAALAGQRQAKQPLDMPSAGSTFRRPEGFYVGPLIEQLGLKGYSIGGAQVSLKHAGFVVNRGGATADDVLALIAYIQKQASQLGVELRPEIKVVGEE